MHSPNSPNSPCSLTGLTGLAPYGQFSTLNSPPILEVTHERTVLDMTRETNVQLDTQYNISEEEHEETQLQSQVMVIEMKRTVKKKPLNRRDQHISLLANMRKQMYGE
jgi:hypothetical protein